MQRGIDLESGSSTQPQTVKSDPGFSLYAWLVLAYNIPVILWGAFVRVSFSGDGCGANWPFCNGQVIPHAMKLPTMIEFAHRMTTTLDTILVVGLCVWAFYAFAKKHPVRRYALLSLLFLFVEALLGAGLVLFRYVAKNQSAGRAWYLSAHLTNTLLLLAVLAATAWFASTSVSRFRLQSVGRSAWIALAVTALIAITGAIAALGDTLFPASSLAAGIHQDLTSPQTLLRLRMWHPIVALAGVAYLLFVASRQARAHRLAAAAVAAMTILQLCAGMVNLSLLAPVWMQLTHLFLADALWIAVVLLALETTRPSYA
jgi:heme a synthase